MDKVYIDDKLKYKLSDSEYRDINKVWKFLKPFGKQFVYVTDRRNYLLKKLGRYSLEEFYYYECIADKLLWNLRDRLERYFDKGLSECRVIEYSNSADLDDKVKKIELDSYYRSFINKLIMVDSKKKLIYSKKMEASPDIFSKNSFNLVSMMVLLDRNVYENVMLDISNYKEYIIDAEYYYQYDYGFPNLNCCVYNFGDVDIRKYRIKKLYYSKDAKNWFKLIIL